jgi:hypothetical protein
VRLVTASAAARSEVVFITMESPRPNRNGDTGVQERGCVLVGRVDAFVS